MTTIQHLGRNIRNIRLLKGMKQELFARKLGITQQNVSRLERQANIPPDKLKAVAKVLDVPVTAIEKFNEDVLFKTVTKPDDTLISRSVKDVIEYFKEEIAKIDRLIETLRLELDRYKSEITKTNENI